MKLEGLVCRQKAVHKASGGRSRAGKSRERCILFSGTTQWQIEKNRRILTVSSRQLYHMSHTPEQCARGWVFEEGACVSQNWTSFLMTQVGKGWVWVRIGQRPLQTNTRTNNIVDCLPPGKRDWKDKALWSSVLSTKGNPWWNACKWKWKKEKSNASVYASTA